MSSTNWLRRSRILVAYRLALLDKTPRAKAVLALAAGKAGVGASHCPNGSAAAFSNSTSSRPRGKGDERRRTSYAVREKSASGQPEGGFIGLPARNDRDR